MSVGPVASTPEVAAVKPRAVTPPAAEPAEAPAVKITISPGAAKIASRDIDHDGDSR